MEQQNLNDMEASGRAAKAKKTKQPSTRGRRSYKDTYDTPSTSSSKTRHSSTNEDPKRVKRATSSTIGDGATHCPPYGALAPTPDMTSYYAMNERTRSANTVNMLQVSPQYADQATTPANMPEKSSSCRYNTRSSVVHKLPLSTAPTMAHMPMNRTDRPPVTTHGTENQQMHESAPVARPVPLQTNKETKDQEGQTDLVLNESVIKFVKMLRSKKINVQHLYQIIENNEYITIVCKEGDAEIQDDDDRIISASTYNQILSVSEARKNEMLANFLQGIDGNVAQMFYSGRINPALQYQSAQHKAECENQNSASIMNDVPENENSEMSSMNFQDGHQIMNTNNDFNQGPMNSSMQEQVMQNSTSPQNISSNQNITRDNQNMYNNQNQNWYFNNWQNSRMARRNQHYFDNSSPNWSHYYGSNANHSRNQFYNGQHAQNWQRGFRMPQNTNNMQALAMAAAYYMQHAMNRF